jgi:hypothetical protein
VISPAEPLPWNHLYGMGGHQNFHRGKEEDRLLGQNKMPPITI